MSSTIAFIVLVLVAWACTSFVMVNVKRSMFRCGVTPDVVALLMFVIIPGLAVALGMLLSWASAINTTAGEAFGVGLVWWCVNNAILGLEWRHGARRRAGA